ncbi:MAG: hypothetical protein WAJ93_13550 [Candidatus Nitrosopolaris sp.]
MVNGAPITSQTIWQVLEQLRQRIKRLVESGAIEDERKQKLEYLLRVKKWNPYCFRHSAITDDSDHLPEYAVKKKARWVMGSKQASRYIKNRMGDELKNKILEHHGIKIASQSQMVSRICGRCNYVNKLESKYCERVGCNYPMTQGAFDEIKAAEQTKMQELVNKSNLERDNTIQELQQLTKKLDCSTGMSLSYLGNNMEGATLPSKSEKKIEEFQEQMKTLPDKDDDNL